MQLILGKLPIDQVLFIQTLIIAVLLFLAIINSIRISKLKNTIKRVTHNQDGMSIETIIHQYYGDIDVVKKNQNELMKEQKEVINILRNCFSKAGMVRFNPFDQVGGDQSFAIALLDRENSGIVISSLYGRNQSRFYGKPIENGKSTYSLSDEEKEAIQRAIESDQ